MGSQLQLESLDSKIVDHTENLDPRCSFLLDSFQSLQQQVWQLDSLAGSGGLSGEVRSSWGGGLSGDGGGLSGNTDPFQGSTSWNAAAVEFIPAGAPLCWQARLRRTRLTWKSRLP